MSLKNTDIGGMQAALKAAHQEGYLGQYDTVDSMLRLLITGTLEQSQQGREQLDKWLKGEIPRITNILLGKDAKNHPPVPTWNAPGGIDKHLKEIYDERGNPEQQDAMQQTDSPEDVLNTVLTFFLHDIGMINEQAQQAGADQELIRMSLDAMFESYVRMLLGLPIEENQEG